MIHGLPVTFQFGEILVDTLFTMALLSLSTIKTLFSLSDKEKQESENHVLFLLHLWERTDQVLETAQWVLPEIVLQWLTCRNPLHMKIKTLFDTLVRQIFPKDFPCLFHVHLNDAPVLNLQDCVEMYPSLLAPYLRNIRDLDTLDVLGCVRVSSQLKVVHFVSSLLEGLDQCLFEVGGQTLGG